MLSDISIVFTHLWFANPLEFAPAIAQVFNIGPNTLYEVGNKFLVKILFILNLKMKVE